VSFFKRLHLQKTRDRPHTPPDINRRAHKAESQLFVRTCHKMAKNRQRSEWPVTRVLPMNQPAANLFQTPQGDSKTARNRAFVVGWIGLLLRTASVV
jgi:hypothetical protein